MVDEVFAAIDVREQCNVAFRLRGGIFFDVQEISWYEVEILGVPFDLFVKFLDAEAIVT